MESLIRIFLIHRYAILVEALTVAFRNHPEVRVVGSASSPDAAKKHLSPDKVDILLIDASFDRDGKRSLIRMITWLHPRLKVVPLGVGGEDEIAKFIEAGASGYVPGEATTADFIEILRAVRAGTPPCSSQVARIVGDKLVSLSRQQQEHPERSVPPVSLLTRREKEILGLLAEELQNQEIAKKLGISIATVKVHVHHIFEKFAVHSRRDAVRRAYELDLLEVPSDAARLQPR